MRAVYVSYDGLLDPLGMSQVIPYVRRLGRRGCVAAVVSFEKKARGRDGEDGGEVRTDLSGSGVRWRPLAYHKTPRVPATLWDCLRGAVQVRREVSDSGAALVHCRGDVAMLMARWAGLPAGVKLLYDVRGFFAEERVDSGSWRAGSALDRLVRREEAKNLRRADGVVVLTQAARRVLEGRCDSLPPIRVIPTCADLDVFRPAPRGSERSFDIVYSGSLGTWYLPAEMTRFVQLAGPEIGGRSLLLTPNLDEASRLGLDSVWTETRRAAPAEVHRWLRRARVCVFFIRPAPSKRASCPTKFAEALACGLPVVCNRGIGDLDEIVEHEGVGVLVEAFTDEAYGRAAHRLARLLEDPTLPHRCRALAERRYDVAVGAAAYESLYCDMMSPLPQR